MPRTRLTRAALRYFLIYLAAPLLTVLAFIDLMLWALFRFAFKACYGVLCLF